MRSYMLPFIKASDLTGAAAIKRLSFTCTRLTQLEVNSKNLSSIKVNMSTEYLSLLHIPAIVLCNKPNDCLNSSKGNFIVGYQRLRIFQLHLSSWLLARILHEDSPMLIHFQRGTCMLRSTGSYIIVTKINFCYKEHQRYGQQRV